MKINKQNLENARFLYYELFGRFFIYHYHENGLKDLDVMLSQINISPLDTYSQNSVKNILEVIDFKNISCITEEYNAIFYDPTTTHLGSSASYYEDGVEFSQKCVKVKNILAKTTIRRNEKIFKEPEDSAGFIFILMSNLIQNETDTNKNLQQELFCDVLNQFIDGFIQNLFNHEKSNIYKDVAILLNSFMDFERLYFDTPKVVTKEKKRQDDHISKSEAQRRATNKARKKTDNQKQRR